MIDLSGGSDCYDCGVAVLRFAKGESFVGLANTYRLLCFDGSKRQSDMYKKKRTPRKRSEVSNDQSAFEGRRELLPNGYKIQSSLVSPDNFFLFSAARTIQTA
jgi:hypothetical protein